MTGGWVVGHIEDGTVWTGPTKRDAVEWIASLHNIMDVSRVDVGDYKVITGYPSDGVVGTWWVMRSDVAHRHGFTLAVPRPLIEVLAEQIDEPS